MQLVARIGRNVFHFNERIQCLVVLFVRVYSTGSNQKCSYPNTELGVLSAGILPLPAAIRGRGSGLG